MLPRPEALACFQLHPDRQTLLVMGGSQGARGINRAVMAALPHLQDAPSLQVIHLAGAEDETAVAEAYAKAGIPAYVAAFHHRMEEAYSAADLALARSGAASLTELSQFALPSMLVPYPFAAEDHQTLNARIFEQAGAAILLPERELTGEDLAKKIMWCLDDHTRLAEMSAQSAQLLPRHAADRVVDTILSEVEGRLS